MCIGHHMALATSDSFGAIKAARTATFRGLGALTVDDASRGNTVTSHRRPSAPDEREIDPSPQALVAPKIEVVLHGGAWRKVLRQCAPLAAGRQNVENGVQHRPKLNFPRPSDATRRRQEKREQKPFRLRRVACINQVIAPILLPGGFSPSHRDLHRISQIRRNHKGLKSLNSFSARLSGGISPRLRQPGFRPHRTVDELADPRRRARPGALRRSAGFSVPAYFAIPRFISAPIAGFIRRRISAAR